VYALRVTVLELFQETGPWPTQLTADDIEAKVCSGEHPLMDARKAPQGDAGAGQGGWADGVAKRPDFAIIVINFLAHSGLSDFAERTDGLARLAAARSNKKDANTTDMTADTM
jgi:hypothetical protein